MTDNIRNGKKYFTTFYYNEFTNRILDGKIIEKMLVNESDFFNECVLLMYSRKNCECSGLLIKQK